MAEYTRYAGTEREGEVYPREVIFHVAQWENGDVYLSYEHYASQRAAFGALKESLALKPDGKFSVVKYERQYFMPVNYTGVAEVD